MLRLKKLLAGFVFATVLVAIPALAQEGGHEKSAESHEEGNLEIWKWANFAILAAVLGWLIAKNAGPMLVARSAEIREGLAAGEKAKAEADARAAAVDARLAGLEKTVAEMNTEAAQEREREAARIRQETQNELARMKRHAEMEIDSAGKLARLEVKHHAAKLALDLAEQKVRARMSPASEKILLDRFVQELSATPLEARQ